jgi:hypothetical protein
MKHKTYNNVLKAARLIRKKGYDKQFIDRIVNAL